MNVGIYVRVSTDLQFEKGHSIPEQTDRLTSYCAAKGWNVYKVYTDAGYSGSNTNRPALDEMLSDIHAGLINMVLVYKLDRLSRSQKDTLHLIEEEFLKNNVDFTSMTENFDTSTPLGRAMIGILSVFAQLEREQIKERMAMGNVARAKSGYWRGGSGAPIGYRYVKGQGLEINEYEAMQIRKVFELFLDGMTFHAIQQYMHERYTTAYGEWNNAAIVSKILTNSTYIGKVNYAGETYDGVHESIIDMDTWEKAQIKYREYMKILDENKRQPYQSTHLLTGSLICGGCGARVCFHNSRHKDKNGIVRDYPTYACYTRNGHKTMRTAKGCHCKPWKSHELEDLIWNEIAGLKFESGKKSKKKNNDIEILQNRIAEIDKQLEKLIDLYSIGNIPLDMVQKRTESLREEREKLGGEILDLKRKEPEMTTERARAMVSELDDVRQSDLETQKTFIKALIKQIVLMPNHDVEIYWTF